MLQRSILINELQSLAREGGNVCQLVQKIRQHADKDGLNSFFVVVCFMEAFGSFPGLFKLPGAECMGGGAYSNDEIDRIILPAIRTRLG